jgi:hypothetical protein
MNASTADDQESSGQEGSYPEWAFGSVSRGNDGVVQFTIGERTDTSEVQAVQAALSVLRAFHPSNLTNEYEQSAAIFVQSLEALASAGGNVSPTVTRQVTAATNAWLGAFTRFRADIEAKEAEYGVTDVGRERLQFLYRTDPTYRLVWELRNVSQHEGNAHQYLSYQSELDSETEESSERYSVQVDRLLEESRTRGINGLASLLPNQSRVNILPLLDQIENHHHDVINLVLAANSQTLDDAISEIASANEKHGNGGPQLHLFRLGPETQSLASGQGVTFSLLSIDLGILPEIALALSIARARIRSAEQAHP